MRRLKFKKRYIPLLILLLLLALAAFCFYHVRLTPAEQLNKLEKNTRQEIVQIMGASPYSLQVSSRECSNKGEQDFGLPGADTIHCSYIVRIHSQLSDKELPKLVETAGWHKKLYADGSESAFRKKGLTCTVETYSRGLLVIDCQSYKEDYWSPLPPPQYGQ